MPKAQRNKSYSNTRRYKARLSLEDKHVVNLSRRRLSAVESKVLGRGMKFVPAVKASSEDLYQEVEYDRLRRNVRLHFFFDEESERDRTAFPVPSSFQPPPIRDDGVETILSTFRNDIKLKIMEETAHQETPRNLSHQEWIRLTQIRHEESTLIKPVDKGGGILIMDKDKYVAEGLKHLTRPEYYMELLHPAQPRTIQMVKQLVFDMRMSKSITPKEATYLIPPEECKPRKFYGLPKYHKERASWPDPHMPPLRPIVTNVGTELSRLSQWLDFWIQDLAQQLLKDSLVKDSYDFVDHLQKLTLDRNADVRIVAADVKDLYTNIPHEGAIAAVMEAWKKPSTRSKRPEGRYIEQALRIILERNDMEFAGRYFLQRKGVAMGTNAAPAIANIFMENMDKMVREGKVLMYKRFIDDLIFLWDDREEGLEEFKAELNNVDPNIQLVFSDSKEQNTFLDVNLMITERLAKEGKIDFKVYIKPTDTLQLLHRTSCHPRHTFKGIVKSQLIRYQRLSSRQEDYSASREKLFGVLVNRGYTERELRAVQTEVENTPVLELQRDIGEKSSSLYLIMKWNPVLRNIPRWARERWAELYDSSTGLQERTHRDLVVSWKRPKNIREMVVRASTDAPLQHP
jgi:Reverse transcriptase (RNA-dependent DNA polymerase)